MVAKNEMRLYEQAFKQRWDVPKEYKQAVIRRMIAVVADPNASNREVTAASRVILSAEAQNQSDEHHESHNATIDAGRNRFLELAERLGIGKADARSHDSRTTNRDTVVDSRIAGDGRERHASEKDGREEGKVT